MKDVFRYFGYACYMVYQEIWSCICSTDMVVAAICFAVTCIALFIIDRHLMNQVSVWFVILASFYITSLISLTILGRPTGQESSGNTLFASYEWLINGGRWGFFPTFLNILMFIPFGVMISRYYKKTKLSIFALLLLPIVIEGVQLITSRGIFEIADILNNFIGGLIGLGIIKLISLKNRLNKVDSIDGIIT